MKYDILITSLPDMDKDKPAPGPAYLKSFLEKHGKKVKVIDGNQIENMDKLVLTIDQYEFNWLGISVFSFLQKDIALELGSYYDNVVYGGSGITPDWTEKNYVTGEGEYALLEFLNGNHLYPGINGRPPQQINDLNELPPPDYSDQLEAHSYNSLILSGSRGCVRNCTFCDVASIWPKYRFVDGYQLAENMHKVVKQTGIKKISFSDSLVNGSMKHFRQLCQALSDNPIKIAWNGQFIARTASSFRQQDFDNLANSGCTGLTIGIESGSENVRHHMRKKFSNEDIDYFVENLGKRQIKMKFLLIVGYPTETRKDFEETKDMLYRYKDYTGSTSVSCHIMRVDKGTPIDMEHRDLYEGIGFHWKNENSDVDTRLKRYIELVEYAQNLGFDFPDHALNKTNQYKQYLEGECLTLT